VLTRQVATACLSCPTSVRKHPIYRVPQRGPERHPTRAMGMRAAGRRRYRRVCFAAYPSVASTTPPRRSYGWRWPMFPLRGLQRRRSREVVSQGHNRAGASHAPLFFATRIKGAEPGRRSSAPSRGWMGGVQALTHIIPTVAGVTQVKRPKCAMRSRRGN
jgi:hypothetical protein